MQMAYQTISHRELLANTTRLTDLSAKVFKDKDTEIQRVPLLQLHLEAQKRNNMLRDAISTQEEIITLYKRAT